MQDNILSGEQSLLLNTHLLNDLTKEELEVTTQALEIKNYESDSVIFAEGELSNDIYLVLEGDLIVGKTFASDGRFFEIAKLGKGRIFGEMAFLDNLPRSATIKSLTKVKLLTLSIKKLKLLNEIGKTIINKINFNIAKDIANNMREVDKKYVTSLHDKLEEYQKRTKFGSLFIAILVLFCVSDLINVLIAQYFPGKDLFHSGIFVWSYIVCLVVPLTVIFYKQYTLKEFGITTQGLGKALIDGLLFTVPMAIGLFGGKLVLLYLLPGLKLRDIDPNYHITILTLFSYLTHAFVQETLVRGGLQTALIQFYDDKKGYKSVILSSAVFSIFHMQFGLVIVIITFFAGIYFGYVKLKNNNIMCVTLVHFLSGMGSFALGII